MTIKEYINKTGVTKRVYVEDWVKKDLIPAVKEDENTGELIFPNSARRPYRPRLKPNAKATAIRASISNACLKREYISCRIYNLSIGEFESLVDDLVMSGLICKRVEDGIVYYDTTPKSDSCREKTIKDISKFIIGCLGIIAEKVSYGTTKAFCEINHVA